MHTSRGSIQNVLYTCVRDSRTRCVYLYSNANYLSSNTKKGEIERTSLIFYVLGDNTNDSSKVCCDVGSCETIIIKQL